MNNSVITNYRERHERVLQDLIECSNIPAVRIKDAMLYALFPGGKRLRPILVYLCGALMDVSQPCLDVIAVAIELTHCYSLIHDDLPAMDNDDLRRGKPSCHKAFDEATAILIGDGMQALAVDILLTHLPKCISTEQVIAVTHELVRACGPGGMVSGQSLDLSELSNPAIKETQLREIHLLKTGKLILACINMVLAASNPSIETINTLRQFASHLGLVFQMQDDYLDRYGKTEILGKGRASDSANCKTTFANLYDKEALFTLISQHFHQAHLALAPFEHRADTLRSMLGVLQKRI
jgi:farnesyl diphosphate synthase